MGCDIRVLQMEGAKDPDEYIIKYGNAKFNILVDKSISEAAKHFGITSNDLGYKVLEEGKSPELVSIFDEKKIIRAVSKEITDIS